MNRLFPDVPAFQPEPVGDTRTLALQSFSYEGRRVILPALADAMTHTGCWLLDRKVTSINQVEYIFEVQQRAILDLYTALIGSGLELTRPSHIELTGICTLLQHNPTAAARRRILHIKLEVSFLEELDLKSILMPGAALA